MSERSGGTPRSGGRPAAPGGVPVWYEVSDAIWLAAHIAATTRAANGAGTSTGPDARPEHRSNGSGPDDDRRTAPPGEPAEGHPAVPPVADTASTPAADLDPDPSPDLRAESPRLQRNGNAPSGHGGGTVTSRRLVQRGGPHAGVRPLLDRRRFEKALRPFKRTADSRTGELELDDEATAERAAEDGLWLIQCRPAAERWLDLDVVVDDGPLAALTRQVSDQFIDVLGTVGAFRTVQVHLLGTGAPGFDGLTLRGTGPLAPARRPSGLASGPRGGRRIVLVLSDGTGDAWHSGAAQRALAEWGRHAPLVLINLLSRRQWRRTAVPGAPARLFAPGPVTANRLYRARRPASPTAAPTAATPTAPAATPAGPARARVPGPDPDEGRVLVPTIELEPGQVATWARFVTASRSSWYGTVTACAPDPDAPAADPWPAPAPDEQRPPPSASELVRRFRAAVSPTVYRLAVHLAAVPLNTPVMRLVQQEMLPESRPSDLVELTGSGLLHRVGPERGPDAERPEEAVFDFAPGVRAELLAGGRRSETARVLLTVADQLGDRVEGLGSLAEMVSEPETARAPALTAGLTAFARPAAQAFRALDGPYRRLAHDLDEVIAGHPGRNSSMKSVNITTQEVSTPIEEPQNPHLPGVGVTIRSIPQVTGRLPSDPPPVWGNVPPQNINFTGRDELLEQLHERLSHGTTAVLPETLHGMGGVGKSQIAIEYVYRHLADYDLIWWIRSERTGQIQQDLAELAGELGLPTSKEVNVAVPAVREALRLGRPYRNWLLIFDNAEELEDVREFFPTNGPGKILVTSRNHAWTKVAGSLEVDVFDRAESQALLRLRGPELRDEEADELAEVLGDLPLAIEQAAVWLAETGMPVDEYLHLFRENHDKAAELLHDAAPMAYELPVAAAWNVSLDRLRTTDPAALQLLQVCAFFAPEPISLRLLSGARNVDGPPELVAALGDPVRLGRAIRAINQYALAKISHKDNTIMLHRLVQRVLVGRLDPDEADLLRSCGHQLMAKFDPEDPALPENWQRYADLLPHILYSGIVRSNDRWTRQLVLNEIAFLFQWGDDRGFLSLAEATVREWTQLLGEDDEQTLAASIHLGRALRVNGRFEEAHQCHVRVNDIREAALGAEDERTLEARVFVSADLRYLGHFQQALELDKPALDTLVRKFGNDDPMTLQQAHFYAIDLRLSGDAKAARDLDRQTYARLSTVFGDRHIKTLASLSAIAVDEMECGAYEEARELTRQNVQRMEETFGTSFAGLTESLSVLAVMERKAGDHERALELSTDAVERFENRYGRFHPWSISAVQNHAVNLRQCGKLLDSIELARQTARDYDEMFGSHHPNTPTANINLAVALRLNGQVDEARRLDEGALEVLGRVLGQDHPRSIVCSINLASDHASLGNTEESLRRNRETLERARRVLGPEHPTTLACAFNLALDLRATGDGREAEDRLAQTIDDLRRAHGPNHPATAGARRGERANCDIYPIPV
ncbi:FxSxx-COOH system tetratricopeptide repeat protein [Spirillospora sp. NBC_01491]|uniref:FxSxx-COOH system tetratricopeptide repeat protein n=1 Tax=Spirillospora sp. NBC_01491 TaxID=2976007 RepID=UPI002E31ADFC|nr:FxSxx-COOH system tetratricopeptide repeat protein [Spirillospora sp. NBC_01491]